MATMIRSPYSAGETIPKQDGSHNGHKVAPRYFRTFVTRSALGVRNAFRLKRKKPLKKIARSRRRVLQEYFALSTAFLLRPENANCLICQVRREHGENILINCDPSRRSQAKVD